MKKALLLMLVLTFALSCGAFAKSLGLPNELINGSWEFGDDTAWLREGGDIVDLTSYFGNPGPAQGEVDTFGYATASSWGVNSGQITQDVYVAPGEYMVDLSGWLCVMDGGMIPSYAELQLLIDDQVVDSARVELAGSGDFTTTGWQYVEINWCGFVAGKKSARVVLFADGQGGGNWPWGIACADGIDLEECGNVVPEPASLLVLLGGLAAIRRRK